MGVLLERKTQVIFVTASSVEQNGKGGFAGCGGSGGKFIFNTTGGGSCGTDGVKGKDGRRGRKGPPGAWGPDGKNGQQQTLDYVTLPHLAQ